MATYTINTDSDQEAAIEQELKIANGKRLEQMLPELSRDEFVAEFFKQTFNQFAQKWKQLGAARVAKLLAENPDKVAEVEKLLSGGR